MSEQNGRVLNLAQLEEVTGGDVEFEHELLEEFLDETPVAFTRLWQGIEATEFPTIQLEAHSLKGSSQSLGIDSLGLIAGKLEQLGQDRRIDGAESLIRELEVEFQKVSEIINQRLRHAA